MESDRIRVAWSGLHRGEEPPVTGTHGSGMIFFSGCPLHCAYCQNHQISRTDGIGVSLTIGQLSSLMVSLQRFGATNINLVTGTQFIPSIVLAIGQARADGMTLPIVWNSSGYESKEGLSLIDPFVDLYLIDMKTLDGDVASLFCGLRRYADVIGPVMDYLVERHPHVAVAEDGSLSGLLVRHLLFPGTLDATLSFLRYFAEHLKEAAWLSLMVQFVPPDGDTNLPDIDEESYGRLIDALEHLEIDNGFVQELDDNIPWIPDFTRDVPFPASFADPLPLFLSYKHGT